MPTRASRPMTETGDGFACKAVPNFFPNDFLTS